MHCVRWKLEFESLIQDVELQDNLNKGVLEDNWYTPQTPLMELSYSSPYGMSDTRSSFDLLDSSMNFDISNTLITSSFRSAPNFAPTLGMGLESNRNNILEDLTCTGQGSSVGLLSSISQGLSLSQCSTYYALQSIANNLHFKRNSNWSVYIYLLEL